MRPPGTFPHFVWWELAQEPKWSGPKETPLPVLFLGFTESRGKEEAGRARQGQGDLLAPLALGLQCLTLERALSGQQTPQP